MDGLHSRDDASDRAGNVEAQLGEWATYGAQLRAWVGLQVDEHVARMLPGILDARLGPISETLMELHRHAASNSAAVERLQDRLDSELHRTELKLGTARLDAHGELVERTRASIAALETQEVEARRDLEKRLEQLEDSTKAHLRAVAQRLEVAEERETDSPRLAVGLKSLNGKVEALGEELARLVQAQTVTENDLPRWKAAQDSLRQLEAGMQLLEKSKETQGDELRRMEEHLRKRFQEQNTSIQSGMEKLRQSMLVLVRTELAKAFRSEAKAIAAMTS
mmetsp:Transcript_43702/g.69447  ORF Transcript_43702/g.69447 Transcript_43702/m.69447 type:complete len:279 (-) Transcript_43702:93-929(-)